MVTSVIGDERAQEADEADSRPHFVDEPARVGARHIEEEPADADPHGGEDRGEEQEDDAPIVPGTPPALPEPVVPGGKDGYERARNDSGPGLARPNRHPEGEDDRGGREVLGQRDA
jgi:hypothetical protein